MCIMEVRPGQKNVTIAQALAHNLNTSKGDLEMFIQKLKAEGDTANLELVETEYAKVTQAYAGMLAVFGLELADHFHDHIHDVHADSHSHDNGNERTFVAEANRLAKLGRRFMTR